MTVDSPTIEVPEDLRDRMLKLRLDEQRGTREVLGQLSRATGETQVPGHRSGLLLTALHAVGERLKVDIQPPPQAVPDANDNAALRTIAHASRLRLRHVRLTSDWWTSDCGHLIAWSVEDDRPLALLRTTSAYEVFDPRDRSMRPLTRDLANTLKEQAVTLCRPLPDSVSGVCGLLRFALTPHRRDLLRIIGLSAAATIVSMFVAFATGLLADHVIPQADRTLAVHLLLGLVAAALGQALLQLSGGIASLRLQTLMTTDSQTAVWDRLLRLPVAFIRRFSSGDLVNRAMMVTSISSEVSGSVVRSLIMGSAAILNLGLMMAYSLSLSGVAILIAFVWCTATAVLTLAIRKLAIEREIIGGRLFGFIVQIINGMARVRIGAAEQRVFNEWGRRFSAQLTLTSRIQSLENRLRLLNAGLTPVSTIVLFWFAAGYTSTGTQGGSAPLSAGAFLAFHASFGMFLHGCRVAGDAIVEVADSVSKFRLVEPLLTERPEDSVGELAPRELTGQVQFRDVTFHYDTAAPPVLKNVNLDVAPGSFVAVVGPSGSGKSTLLKLLLGFEQPTTGRVLLDGCDLTRLDMTSVRQQMGVVMQSSHITVGTIRDNIAMGCSMNDEQIMVAVRDAGLADDIDAMPMGLHTMLSEAGSNLSGGQKQRLMIARALVRNPRLLLFDEATSALDNRTQAIIADSIARRGITRIVVAHRLSTIRNADQVVVIQRGEIAESGTFAELSETAGFFRSLLERQALR